MATTTRNAILTDLLSILKAKNATDANTKKNATAAKTAMPPADGATSKNKAGNIIVGRLDLIDVLFA